MDSQDLTEFLDQQRWLLNNGLITDSVKNQLFFCGSVVHSDVQAVELSIEAENKKVNYTIYVGKDLLKKIDKYNSLVSSKTLFKMWQFRRLLKKEGSLDFQSILNKFVKDFCGPKWSASVNVVDYNNYIDSIEDNDEHSYSSEQFDKLPDR
jgi:hypothetical protein